MNNKRFVVEVVDDKKRALLLYAKKSKVSEYIKLRLAESHEVYESTDITGESVLANNYDTVVCVGLFPKQRELLKKNRLSVFFFFYDPGSYKHYDRWCSKHLQNYKIVNIGKSDRKPHELIDFVLFKTPVPYSFNYSKEMKPRLFQRREIKSRDVFFVTLKIAISFLIFSNILFLSSFAYEWFGLWNLWRQQNKGYDTISRQYASVSATRNIVEKLLFIPTNTLFWVPGIDTFFTFVTTTHHTVDTVGDGLSIMENYSQLGSLFLKKNKNEAEKREVSLRIAYVRKNTKKFIDQYDRMTSAWKKTNTIVFNKDKDRLLAKADKLKEYLPVLEQLNSQLTTIFGADKPKKYLLLFMNNMELRPGGGFIGSVGTLEFSDFSLKNLSIYDVYTLDGQLKAHLDPPQAIRKFLDQPHWFLRDSAFASDFSMNANQALQFVKTEVGWEGYDGVIGVTFSAVQRMLGLFPNLYIPSYKESVTPDNFFYKAQSYADQNFFPGSQQKKNFLEAVFRVVITNLNEGEFDMWKFTQLLRSSLDEKFIVAYFLDSELQGIVDGLFWSGRLVRPGCSIEQSCYYDYLSVTDANLGVNKANFFVQRTVRLSTTIHENRTVGNKLIIDYYNDSQPNIFPGGLYRNYVQILLPPDAKINNVLVDGAVRTDFDEQSEQSLKKVGILLEIPPQGKNTLTLEYVFGRLLTESKNYQLIVQKQVGSLNNDFIYEMRTGKDLEVLHTNFQPVVDTNGFVYNTFLEKDRLLLVTFK